MADNNKRLQKGLEKRQKNLNANLEALKEKLGEKKDDCVDFHAIGIDHIFVDESHYQNFFIIPFLYLMLLKISKLIS